MAETAESASKTLSIAELSELGEEAMALLDPAQHPLDYLGVLGDKRLYPDAVKFLAHALPRREAVWWAWMCARKAAGEGPKPKIQAALTASEKWIADPSEENRWAAKLAAEQATYSSAAGCAALAAGYSGESLTPPGEPVVPPGPYLAAKMVATAVICAAVAAAAPEVPERFRTFISQAVDVSNRIRLWQPAKT
jgi:hypothetical protein